MPYADPDEYRRCARESARRRRATSEGKAADAAISRAYYARNAEARRDYSRQYRLDNPDIVRASRRRGAAAYRARKRGAFVEIVDHEEVFERDLYECQICGCIVYPDARRFEAKKATIDHIVPLSKGGEHSYENIQTACWMCNHLKSDTLAV